MSHMVKLMLMCIATHYNAIQHWLMSVVIGLLAAAQVV